MHRSAFPVTDNLIYLNHAAVGPLCRPAAEAMEQLAEDALHFGSIHYGEWMATYDGLRRAAARLINAVPEEIALLKNTSEGIATMAMGLDWHAGDRIVAFEEEFPANQYPWRRLEAKGVKITWLSAAASLDRIDEAARGARLLALSFVQYLTGHRADLNAIGEICHRHGAIFFVDAIQGLGAFPLDVRAAHIGALAADGHKWLVGPEGCAIFYLSRELQDQVEPLEFGWTNAASFEDYASRDMALRPDAGRYECGTLNTIGCHGLRVHRVPVERRHRSNCACGPGVGRSNCRRREGAGLRDSGGTNCGKRSRNRELSKARRGLRGHRGRLGAKQNLHSLPGRMGAGFATFLYNDKRNRHDAGWSSVI